MDSRRLLWPGKHVEPIKGAKNNSNHDYLEKAPIEAKIKARNTIKIRQIFENSVKFALSQVIIGAFSH